MNMKPRNLKVRVSKCYLVQVIDSNGNELDSQYIFGSRNDAERRGTEMKTKIECDLDMKDIQEDPVARKYWRRA